MSEQRDKAFVQHSIDTGLESMQGNPFLAQRIMNQERTEQPVMKKKISFAFILAMILLIVSIATAVAGAINEDFNTWLYRIWPEAAMKLMPVDLSCEKEGIEMALINAVADDNEMYLTFSMKDLEGDRINAYSNLYMGFTYDFANDPMTTNMENYRYDLLDDYMRESGETPVCMVRNENPVFDPDTKRIIYGEHVTFYTGNIPSSGTFTATVPWLGGDSRSSYVDLLPMLKEYGDQAAVANAPWNATYVDNYGYNQKLGTLSDTTRVLDWQNGLDIPLTDTIRLSGIGMVDGQLHVQIHYVNYKEITIGEYQYSYEYAPESVYISLYDSDEEYGYDSNDKYRDKSKLDNGIHHLTWGSLPGDPRLPEWEEYIFTVDSELTEAQTFTAEASYNDPPLMGMWEVNIPVRLIQKK
ncbi:MAG: DUF4179 domain-containing protein [Clostridia bacterium]|nr:DUF4179 domain-containing protein [Clostridia bacterium]